LVHHLQNSFQGEFSYDTSAIILIVALVIVLAGVAWVLYRNSEEKGFAPFRAGVLASRASVRK